MATKTQQEKISEANAKACHWLAMYNEAVEKGDETKAEKYLAKAQRWLDKLNELEGYNS
jgi:hypothetical protein